MTCQTCGAMASPTASFCASCGNRLGVLPPSQFAGPPTVPVFVQTRTSGMAIAGFVLSLVACGILGLIFSVIGHNECKRSNGLVTGQGLALAGIIISIVRIVLEICYVVFVVWAVDQSRHW